MHATPTAPPPSYGLAHILFRNLAWFLVVPVTVTVTLLVLLALLVGSYRAEHQDRIYTGVSVWGVDLSGLDQEQARQALAAIFPYANEQALVLTDPTSGRQWSKTPTELGLSLDLEQTVAAAFRVGRGQGAFADLRQQFETWYYGNHIAPVLLFDEGEVDAFVAEVAATINRPARDATLTFDGNQVDFADPQLGRELDQAQTRTLLLSALGDLRTDHVNLPVRESSPAVLNTGETAQKIRQITGSPFSFYLDEPLTDLDLSRATISTEELTSWLRLEQSTAADGTVVHNVFLDQNAVRHWLSQFEEPLYRDPVRARFYFDDSTRQLVLVEPHVNGRALDVDGTLDRFLAQVQTADRSLPFVLKEVEPVVNSNATAADLGITELVSSSTTWFRGSSPERKHNIARSAVNFYGIVISPGEEFSFNQWLGEISPEEGYETGLIIIGGRTIEGVGGGVCQVSTTVYQSAFWAGFPIEERWAHGYRVPYYDDGEGAGMDATIFSPEIDFRFINNTPYHLLIENYYDEASESLTFKFYSTSLGRRVEKSGPVVEDVVPPNPDVWEFNADLEPGEVRQIDWAVEGSRVTVGRTVYNANGDLLLDDTFVSNYIPWQNVYQYGPGVTAPGSEPVSTLPAEAPTP